jgi:DNA polymerase (family 10)
MDKVEIALVLDEIGTLLEIQGENPFRCLAYHNAARSLEQLGEDLTIVIKEERLAKVRGIGEAMVEKILTLAATGSLPFHEELKKKTPAGLLQMLALPGVGPKKIKALYTELGIESLELLKQGCLEGKVAELKGFGAKTQQKILEGLEFLGKSSERVRIDEALDLATVLVNELTKKAPGIERIEIGGSLRRRRETIRDIDLLAASENPGPIMDAFVTLPGVIQITGKGETKSSVVVDRNLGRGRHVIMNADLRVVRPEQFPFALHYFTGSKDHNVAVRGRAQQYGLKLNEYELVGPKRRVKCPEEADVFKSLELDFIPPELREHTGEIEAAAKHELPTLVEAGDLRGTFHCHTNWSDGTATIKEMAKAAQSLGYRYLGIGDHSQSLTVANGLTPDRVQEQFKEIDALNAKLKGFHIFKGTECDILADGQLDFPDSVLAGFDYVVASVHSHFNQTSAEMTERIIRAIRNQHVTMLGHATGRILLRREGYKVDLEAVLRAAAEHGVMVEINAHPHRLDIDWIHCKRAKELGVLLVINPDAHSTDEIALTRFGVDVARRGWLEKKDVFNTRSVEEVAREFEARRSKAQK